MPSCGVAHLLLPHASLIQASMDSWGRDPCAPACASAARSSSRHNGGRGALSLVEAPVVVWVQAGEYLGTCRQVSLSGAAVRCALQRLSRSRKQQPRVVLLLPQFPYRIFSGGPPTSHTTRDHFTPSPAKPTQASLGEPCRYVPELTGRLDRGAGRFGHWTSTKRMGGEGGRRRRRVVVWASRQHRRGKGKQRD